MKVWIDKELEDINLGDARLNERSKQILESFFSKSSSSINGSFKGWSAVKAAYRFFDNKQVSLDQILKPHYEASIRRIANEEVILCIQDTTIVSYSHRAEKVSGLGYIRNINDQGFLLHPTIAFNNHGVCLGVIDSKTFIREEIKGKKQRQIVKPIEDKESIRWIESYRLTNNLAKQHKDKLFINMADREGDFYEFLREYEAEEGGAHIIVRAKSDRVLESDETDDQSKLWNKVKKQSVIGKIVFKMNQAGNKRKARTVIQTVKACQINLSPPRKVKQLNELQNIKINAILCREEHPPHGEKAVEWLLLTSLEITKESMVLEIVKYYQLRWQIEMYFKILKSGCKIEELQLESIERLKNCIAIYMIVAWRILCLSTMARVAPNLSADLFYEVDEWKALYMIVYKKPPPNEAPSLYAMNRLVATVGGFLNRKHDKEPGIKSMWIGLQRLKDFTLAYETFNQINNCG